jgi:predicted DNA-binding transcriptional regulator
MKNKKPNAELVWKQLEDQLAPRLGLSVIERTVYSHLLRHSRLEGKVRLRFSIRWLSRNIQLSSGPVRQAVRRLVAQGALRLVQRSKTGHVVEVRLPEEIRPERLNGTESRAAVAVKEDGSGAGAAIHIEEADFLQNTTLRKAIHARERGLCFTVCAGPHPGSSAWITSCRGAVGMQFLPQPGLELHRMQLAERREAGGRFSPAALPRGPLERQRTRRPPPCSRRPGHRQTTPCCARK